jgi:hypothetical protein
MIFTIGTTQAAMLTDSAIIDPDPMSGGHYIINGTVVFDYNPLNR